MARARRAGGDGHAAIAERRLRNQLITSAGLRRPADVVQWFGAVQGQEYEHAKWALGLRLRDGATDASIERAFAAGEILRTHVMRPTWHLVTSADIRWLVELTAPRVRRSLTAYQRSLGLDARTVARGIDVIARALLAHGSLTRGELRSRLRERGLEVAGQRLAHLMMHAELECVVCSGPRRGKQFTYALVEARAPHAKRLPHDEALATLCRRFLRSHGPATLRDFVWWSGLFTADARRALEMVGARREDASGLTYWSAGTRPAASSAPRVHLLPVYDEYIVAYRDREAVPHGPDAGPSLPAASVTFRHALVAGGQVAGTWRVTRGTRGAVVNAFPLRRLARVERQALARAARRYEGFLGIPVELAVD